MYHVSLVGNGRQEIALTRLIFALLLASLLWLPSIARGQQHSEDASAQVNSFDAAQSRDASMCNQLKAVERYVRNYCQRKPFPAGKQNEAERKRIAVELQLLIPQNPYAAGNPIEPSKDKPQSDEPDEDPGHLFGERVLFSEKSTDYIDKASLNPPDEWQDEPGTVHVLGQDKGRYCIWAADANHKPVKDPKTHKYFVLSGTLGAAAKQ